MHEQKHLIQDMLFRAEQGTMELSYRTPFWHSESLCSLLTCALIGIIDHVIVGNDHCIQKLRTRPCNCFSSFDDLGYT